MQKNSMELSLENPRGENDIEGRCVVDRLPGVSNGNGKEALVSQSGAVIQNHCGIHWGGGEPENARITQIRVELTVVIRKWVPAVWRWGES